MGRLVALVPKPRVNLTRFHGVFSRGDLPPRSKLREFVVPAKPAEEAVTKDQPGSMGYSMTWAQRLKRVFAIEIEKCEKCEKCGGNAKIIVDASNRCIEAADVIEKILKHLRLDEASQARNRSPPEGLFSNSDQLF